MVQRSRFWKYFRSYFPCKLVKTVDLDPNKNYIYAAHPHGFWVYHSIGNLVNEHETARLFPHHKHFLATIDANVLVPITREVFLSLGKLFVLVPSPFWLNIKIRK